MGVRADDTRAPMSGSKEISAALMKPSEDQDEYGETEPEAKPLLKPLGIDFCNVTAPPAKHFTVQYSH